MRGSSHAWRWRTCAAVYAGAFLLFVGAVCAQPFAGSAIRFNGAEYVSIPHNAAYNNYPFTVSAWIRTTNFNPSPEAIVSKYFSNGRNGFSMHTFNGELRAWFFRDINNYIWNPLGDGQGVNGGYIADGRWHHAVFAVDQAGGRLFVDGVLKQNMIWSGTAGIPTTTAPLHFGAIANFGTFLKGDVDEVSLWNYALTNNSVNYIKFRRLNGNEAGLVSYWRLNEGSGTTVNETAPTARTGTLIGGPQWINSTAPIALSPVAGTGISFDGLDDQITVNHAPALNAYPLTVTAWFRTSRNSANYDAIVNKYPGGSGNGYSLHVRNGRLAAFYFNPNGGRVYTADPGFDGGFVADGQWHHVAFLVDTNGGRLYLDGVQTGSQSWVLGAPGPPTDTNAVSFGRYPGQSSFSGQIDEVAIWNRTFTSAEIAAMHNLRLVGSEPNLVGYWPMNEGSGNLAADFTGNGRTATLLPTGAFWIGSLARLGDGSTYFLPTLDQASYGRLWANQASPNLFHFPINHTGGLRRFHDFGPAPAPLSLEIMTDAVLRNGGGQLVPLKFPSLLSFPLDLVSENANAPATNSFIPRDGFVAIDPVQLDSVNGTYAASITLSYSVNGGPAVTNSTLTLPSTKLLHFNGHLRFGSVDTVFTQIGNNPAPGALSGGGINTLLSVVNNSGYLAGSPSHTYGTGAVWNVLLFPDGHAERTGNFTVPINGPQPDRSTVANITFKRDTMILTNTGLRSGITLCLPVGFSWSATNNRTAASEYPFDYDFALGTNLLPVASVLSESYVFDWVEETKPFWIRGSGISWNVPAGEITLGAPASLLFVRESVDYALETNAFNLIDPQLRHRISNDAYFRGATTVNGPVTVRADSNGLALLNIDMALAGGQFRPHFPYSPRNGGAIFADSGRLVISNDVVNLVQSALQLADQLSVYYARDCDETNCAGVTTVGPGIINFGAGASDTLQFTPDGGLVANGTVNPQGLTWGYAGGTNYAQRTSTLEEGSYHMPGTFLFRSATTLSNDLLPAVLLFTGVGNGVNTTYIERPGELAYADGFANYAGVNFRGVELGRSYIANQNTEWYELTPRSKYYARYGGISGIHESGESFEMTLYGYETSLQSYRLSYLDSENWQSRTDGSVHLPGPLDAPPGPAGFDLEFQELKFLCRGGLDSARVAPFTGEKYLSYWNTYFTPQSVQFRETNGDNCNLGNRFLVVGAETKLPFIPQKLHAALGFRPNGNLVTAADNVNGCDSRFPVPPELHLQGPARGTFKIATAAHGYFNNWAIAGRPDRGFYNIVGKLDLPFFEDSKIHLHVEALSRTSANVFVMGGWRASDKHSHGEEGWTVGSQNFFNTAGFDATHRGFPIEVTLNGYRNSTTERYHPRAQQQWLDLVEFDYGLSWNPATHRFKSIEDARVELPIIDVMSGLKDMTPGKVDIDFSQDIKLGLPRLKLLDFANDAVDEFNGPLLSVSNAVYDAFQGAVNSSGLTSGFRSMQRLLRDETDRLFRPVLDPVLNVVVSNIYPVLSNALASDAANFLNTVSNTVGSASSGLRAGVQTINGTTGQVNSVLGEVNKVLTDMDDTLGLFLRIIEKTNGQRRVVRIVVQKIVKDQGPELGFVVDVTTGLADNVVNDLLVDLEPTLVELESQLRKIRGELNSARSQLALLSGDFNQSIGAIANNAQALNQYVGLAGAAVSNLMYTVKTAQADFFTANPEEAKRQLRERLLVGFLSSSMPARYQETFKRFFYDDNALANQIVDTLFQQINVAVRNGLQQQITSATDNTFNGMKGPGFMSGSLLAAKIRGAPEFRGDSIEKIRLDADVNMRLPDDMKFRAFMVIKQLDSQNTPISCIPAGGPAAEITLGATEVPLAWAGLEGGQTLDVSARWSLQNNKSVYGVGGALELRGDTKVKSASISSLGAALAIGQFENYFAARAAGSAKGGAYSFSAELGFFAGRTCRPEPLKMVDPEVEVMLANPTDFTGIYVTYGGKFPFTQLIGVPPSCFFRADGSMKTVLYYQGGPRSGMFAGRLKIGIDVELLCILGAHVDYGPFLKVSGTELSFGGTAHVCGKLGVCPFCVEGCADLTIKGVVNDGGIDYFVDF